MVRAIGNGLHGLFRCRPDHASGRAYGTTRHAGQYPVDGSNSDSPKGWSRSVPWGQCQSGADGAVEVFELVGASTIRGRLQASAARGSPVVGRRQEPLALQQALESRGGAWSGGSVGRKAGVGKSRTVYEFVHSHHTSGWLVLESASVSYGKATPYSPVIDLLRRYCHVEEHDDTRTIRAKVTGQVLTLDETLQDTVPRCCHSLMPCRR